MDVFTRPNASVVDQILHRDAIYEIFESLEKQDNPYLKAHQLTVAGSAVPMLTSALNGMDIITSRIPSDLDLQMYCKDNGEERFTDGRRINKVMTKGLDTKPRTENLLKTAAAEAGFKLVKATGSGSNYSFVFEKGFSSEEISHVMHKPDVSKLMHEMYKGRPNLNLDNFEPQKIELEVHLFPRPLTLFPPEPFPNNPSFGENKLSLMHNSDADTIGLKVARLMVPPDHPNHIEHYNKLTDIVDVYDILKVNEKLGKKNPDSELLRLLTVTMLSSNLTSVDGLDAVRFAPTEENVKTYRKELQQHHVHVSEEKMRDILVTVDGLIQQIFPNRSADQPNPLTGKEKEFIENVIYAEAGMFDVAPLKEEYKALFEKHPGLEHRIQDNPGLIVKTVDSISCPR